MEMADAIASALGEDAKRVRLHLKTVRLGGGNIKFTGYGRGAATMGPLDAARLVIALAASSAARHADDALRQFKDLVPLGKKGRGLPLDKFLAEQISKIRPDGVYEGGSKWPPRYDLAAEEALKLTWCPDPSRSPRIAVVRWSRPDGGSDAATFASEPMPMPWVNEARLARLYPSARMFRSTVITASALREIALAL